MKPSIFSPLPLTDKVSGRVNAHDPKLTIAGKIQALLNNLQWDLQAALEDEILEKALYEANDSYNTTFEEINKFSDLPVFEQEKREFEAQCQNKVFAKKNANSVYFVIEKLQATIDITMAKIKAKAESSPANKM